MYRDINRENIFHIVSLDIDLLFTEKEPRNLFCLFFTICWKVQTAYMFPEKKKRKKQREQQG